MQLCKTYKGLTVFVTGHTGFKGTWLTLWLHLLGAKVIGYSQKPPTTPNHFDLIGLQNRICHIIGDVQDAAHLRHAIGEHQPEIVFHLAAQPIVLHSYTNPKETFDVNSGGTVNVLEAMRHCPSVKAGVMITSDKCYENVEWIWGYRENDPIGGKDPYSASKAMAELVVGSYRDSFFQNGPAVATARAGNVIGGGDFSDFRIVPDTMKALMEQVPIEVRSPKSVRPWLHVLEPLWGYLLLGSKLLHEGNRFAQSWNFGPKENLGIEVEALVKKAVAYWGSGEVRDVSAPGGKKEMGLLRLNWDKAAHVLGWSPQTDWQEAIKKTVDWFKVYQQKPSELFNYSSTCIKEYDHALSTNPTCGILPY
jgi:CDP-glucose 4,6-dehydratase